MWWKKSKKDDESKASQAAGGNLENEFKKRNPWVTKFVIGGKEFGGDFDALNDKRLEWFFQYFPEASTILELGSLEGGHTFGLAQRPQVKRVLGIEGRQSNIDKAQFVQQLLNVDKVEFINANLEKTNLARWGQFDAIFCVGLLYHLPNPWNLVEQMARVSKNLFIWTHYADSTRADKTVNGYRGMLYQEHGMADSLSGMSAKSFWPTFEALTEILNRYGFTSGHTIEDDRLHPHGPAITLAAVAP